MLGVLPAGCSMVWPDSTFWGIAAQWGVQKPTTALSAGTYRFANRWVVPDYMDGEQVLSVLCCLASVTT